jgi:hypothetical protein
MVQQKRGGIYKKIAVIVVVVDGPGDWLDSGWCSA